MTACAILLIPPNNWFANVQYAHKQRKQNWERKIKGEIEAAESSIRSHLTMITRINNYYVL